MLNVLETTDFEALDAAQENWDVRHRPTKLGKLEGHFLLGNIGKIQIDLERWNMPIELSGISADGLGFAFPLQEDDSYLSAGITVDSRCIDIYRPEQEIYAVTRPSSGILAVTIYGDTEVALHDEQQEKFSNLLKREQQIHSISRGSAARLRQWALRLLKLSASDGLSMQARSRLHDETLFIFMEAMNSATVARREKLSRRATIAHRARDFMLDRQANPPLISEVCNSLHVSERLLHQSFLDVYGVSPKHFLKAQRLLAARAILKEAPLHMKIYEICVSLGFFDQGRFSRDYQLMFGELPSTTLKRKRIV